jgi:hypothetical protein
MLHASAAHASAADDFVHHSVTNHTVGNNDSDGDSDVPMVLKKMRNGARAAWRQVSYVTCR